jgi:hypothetical protein
MSVDRNHVLRGGGGGDLMHAMDHPIVVVALTAIVDPRPPVGAVCLLPCRTRMMKEPSRQVTVSLVETMIGGAPAIQAGHWSQ